MHPPVMFLIRDERKDLSQGVLTTRVLSRTSGCLHSEAQAM